MICALLVSSLYPAIPTTQPRAIVFDLGGVLFESDISASLMLKQIGIKTLLLYILNPYASKKNLKKKIFAYLEKVKPRSIEQQAYPYIPTDEQHNPLPLLMEEWLAGSLSGHDILALIEKIVQNDHSFFGSHTEKEVILKIISLIFDAHLFVKMQRLHPDAMEIIQLLKNNGFQIYALSNWDKTSFEILKKKYKVLFSLFDGIMISGVAGGTKPSPSFYEAFLDMYQLTPESCIFVDDQRINVLSARKVGMRAFVCPYTKSIYKKSRANLLLVSKTIQKMIKKIEQVENILLAQV
ncbi:MAG TPA: HAD-IA family hydrolase [Patescibacteria group bacterium]|jgi:HAD superfamily hydrolase (TIGR01509 family)|nr:HAD-IA family hydrolase [Patescibacteria group bacterium]